MPQFTVMNVQYSTGKNKVQKSLKDPKNAKKKKKISTKISVSKSKKP